MRTRFLATSAVAALPVLAAACAEGVPTGGVAFTGSVNDASVRLINALTAAQALDFAIDGRVVSSGTVFGAAVISVSFCASAALSRLRHCAMSFSSGSNATTSKPCARSA